MNEFIDAVCERFDTNWAFLGQMDEQMSLEALTADLLALVPKTRHAAARMEINNLMTLFALAGANAAMEELRARNGERP